MFTTFVINLDKDIERLRFMDEQLTRLGITYTRQPAIYGKTHTTTVDEYDEAKAVAATGHALLPGELGCALSHRVVYERIVAEGVPFALVLEDDVVLPSDFKQVLERMIAEQPKTNFEYLLFDYVPVGWPYVRQWFLSIGVNVRERAKTSLIRAILFLLYACIKVWYIVPLALFEGWRDQAKKTNPGPVRFFRPVYFAGAYLVTQEGAKKLLSLAQPVIYTADQLPNRARVLRGLRFFCYAPLAVRQDKAAFGSSILELAGKDIELGYD